MKHLKNILFIISSVLMCVCLSSCPIQSEDFDDEKPTVIVRTKADYRDNIVASVEFTETDTFISQARDVKTLEYIINDYYILTISGYKNIIYLNVDKTDWSKKKDTAIANLKEYVLEYNPFIEIYECNKNFNIGTIREYITKEDFSKFKKIK